MSREQRAIAVLAAGGYFRKQLETTQRGRGRYAKRFEQFHTRLHDASGRVVDGIGFQTWAALSSRGVIVGRHCAPSTVWPEEWELNPGRPDVERPVDLDAARRACAPFYALGVYDGGPDEHARLKAAGVVR